MLSTVFLKRFIRQWIKASMEREAGVIRLQGNLGYAYTCSLVYIFENENLHACIIPIRALFTLWYESHFETDPYKPDSCV